MLSRGRETRRWFTSFWNGSSHWLVQRGDSSSKGSTRDNWLHAWEYAESLDERMSCRCRDYQLVWRDNYHRHPFVVDEGGLSVWLGPDRDENLLWITHCHVHLRSKPSSNQDSGPIRNTWLRWFHRCSVCANRASSSDFRSLRLPFSSLEQDRWIESSK